MVEEVRGEPKLHVTRDLKLESVSPRPKAKASYIFVASNDSIDLVDGSDSDIGFARFGSQIQNTGMCPAPM